jgi:hypothetical protein
MTQRKTLNHKIAQDAGWEEGKHPRGQPGNAGEFTAHVAGNKIYKSAPEAISAANAEHQKSGSILGVEKYDPAKHPTAKPAASGESKPEFATPHRKGDPYPSVRKPADVHVGPSGEKQGYGNVGHKGFADKSTERDGTWKTVGRKETPSGKSYPHVEKSTDPLDKVLSSGKRDPNRNHYPNRWPKDSPQQKDISRQLTELHSGKPTATDPDSPEQIAKFKNGTESLRDRMARSAETYKGTEVGAVKNAIQGAVKEGKAFSPNEAARQQVLANGVSHAHHEIGDHVSYGNGRGGQIVNLTNTHAVIQQPEGAGHSAPDTVPLEQITKNHTAQPKQKTAQEISTEKWLKGKSGEYGPTKDAQPGMITQPNSGGALYKGRDLDKDPVGDRSMPSSDCSGGAGWPGRVL